MAIDNIPTFDMNEGFNVDVEIDIEDDIRAGLLPKPRARVIDDSIAQMKQMAEQATDTCLANTAGIIGVPVRDLWRNLSRGGLRLLCISVAAEVLSLDNKAQMAKNEVQLAELMRTDTPQAPGC